MRGEKTESENINFLLSTPRDLLRSHRIRFVIDTSNYQLTFNTIRRG